MENSLPLIVLGIAGLIALGIVWYIITRFLVNIGATEVGIKERRYFGRRMPQGRVVANAGEVGIQAEVLKPGLRQAVSVRMAWPALIMRFGQSSGPTAIPAHRGGAFADRWI